MSGKAKIKAKSINARLELMDSLITHHLWCISNKNLAYSTLKQVCDAINNVQRMSFATPFFIAGGAVFVPVWDQLNLETLICGALSP